MAAWPSRMAISEFGANVMDGPVGNSPGPDSIASVTGGQLLIALPSLSTMVTMSCASSVPSTEFKVVLSAVNFSAAGMPLLGQAGGGMCRYSLRYQYHCRFGSRK